MKFRRLATLCCIALWALGMNALAAPALPAEVLAAMRDSGVPERSFGFYAQPVDKTQADDAAAIVSMNAEQPFLLASTTKVVTSLAALDLLGPSYPWPLSAFTTAPVQGGQMKGNLVIAGRRHAISADELSRWFVQMHAEGLSAVTGNIVLNDVLLMSSHDPAIGNAAMAAGTFEPPPPTASGWSDRARQFNAGTMLLSIEAGSGDRARISLVPQPLGVQVVNDVMMVSGPCDAWAAWSTDSVRGNGTPQLLVRGHWDVNCPKEYVAYVHPLPGMKFMPNTAPREPARAGAAPVELSKSAQVARLWIETGGTLSGRVSEGTATPPSARTATTTAPARWSSAFSVPLSQVVREINKTSDNLAACNLLLSLAPSSAMPGQERRDAKARVHEWLIGQGLLEGDIHIDLGSGQSREERGKPRAMVQLLRKAWKTEGAQAFVNSLPIAGVDGTLANRMREGSATGQAFLKTGTLSDTRALAGYVRSRSGVVYAVAAIVNHPDAARARGVLDAFIAWLARNG